MLPMKPLFGVLTACQLVLLPVAALATEEKGFAAKETDEVKAIVDAEFNPLTELGRERRRQMQVRQSLQGALEQSARGDVNLAALLEACADYMVVSMSRLDLTDMNIHDLLRERVPRTNAQVHEGLELLGQRQEAARAATAVLAEALRAYRDGGRANVATFDQAIRHYHRIVSDMMTPRKNPYSKYTDELFSRDDWAHIAAASDETIATEHRLFDAVTAAAADGLKPESFSGTHGMQPPPTPNR